MYLFGRYFQKKKKSSGRTSYPEIPLPCGAHLPCPRPGAATLTHPPSRRKPSSLLPFPPPICAFRAALQTPVCCCPGDLSPWNQLVPLKEWLLKFRGAGNCTSLRAPVCCSREPCLVFGVAVFSMAACAALKTWDFCSFLQRKGAASF